MYVQEGTSYYSLTCQSVCMYISLPLRKAELFEKYYIQVIFCTMGETEMLRNKEVLSRWPKSTGPAYLGRLLTVMLSFNIGLEHFADQVGFSKSSLYTTEATRKDVIVRALCFCCCTRKWHHISCSSGHMDRTASSPGRPEPMKRSAEPRTALKHLFFYVYLLSTYSILIIF